MRVERKRFPLREKWLEKGTTMDYCILTTSPLLRSAENKKTLRSGSCTATVEQLRSPHTQSSLRLASFM